MLSEKTVSVHVSNMLRKTGTTNRVELAQLAHRPRRSRERLILDRETEPR